MPYTGEIRNAETLGLMLQQARVLRGATQQDLANDLGVSQRWISEMEAGKPGLLMNRLFDMLRANHMHLYAEIEKPNGSETSNG
jgi:HTH-type transcriptional regulator/antitoxin HipB